MDNSKKCNKYETLFIFQNDEELKAHLENCPECKAEYEKYMKVSRLVKEVGAEYLAKKKREKLSAIKKIACCFIMITSLSVAYTGYNFYNDYSFRVNSAEESCIDLMGLPVDSYGFLEI